MSDKPVILINVFTVAPAKQQELIELLTRATEDSVRRAAGSFRHGFPSGH